ATVTNNFKHERSATADFFNKICMIFGLRTVNFKYFFDYCLSKGWVTVPVTYTKEYFLLRSLNSAEESHKQGVEIELSVNKASNNKHEYITTLFMSEEEINKHSITDVRIIDEEFSPFLIPGDRVGMIKGDKYHEKGYYLISNPKEPFSVFSQIKIAEIEVIDKDNETYKVSLNKSYLEGFIMKRDSFNIVAFVAFITRKRLSSENKYT
ncbi:hypothetical protein, partial [Psittacicella hinzii]